MEFSRKWVVQEAERRMLSRRLEEKEPYFFSIPEIILWGRTLTREDMSLVFYEPEDIEALAGIFKDISDSSNDCIYKDHRGYYLDTLYKQYNFNVTVPKDKTSSSFVTQQIANKWDSTFAYFQSIKPNDYVQFVNYCTAFLRHDLHTFIFFVPNYMMGDFSTIKEIDLYYHWRLALNR